MKKLLLALLAATLVLGLTAAPSIAGKKKKPKTFTLEETGTITAMNPVGMLFFGVTEGEFVQTGCAGIPTTQGLDGWVIQVPAELMSQGGPVSLKGTGSAVPHDLALYFYDSSCTLMDPQLNAGADEAGLLPAGAAWIVIDSLVGANTTFTLTATTQI
ncbi:MAG TPA: hypothetical protein VHJ82_05595 [Actinomycetota bacterium]|nr:hypothetical protein [Actinomycetota bacterium]